MPRYFLNLRRDHLSVRDARGVECSGPTEALETAVVMALKRISESDDFARWAGWVVEVETETGEHVATIPFALGWRMCLNRNHR